MALNLKGTSGTLRQGTRTWATVTSWAKKDRRITFTVGRVNAFAQGLGPPTHIALDVRSGRLVYPIVGEYGAGAVKVDPVGVVTEQQEGITA